MIFQVQGRIFNLTFALAISFLLDIYNVYSCISCLLQEVNVLPFERLEKFDSLLDSFRVMLATLELENCPCSPCLSQGFCLWPTYHTDLREVVSTGKYLHIPMGQLLPDSTRTRAGGDEAAANVLADVTKVVSTANSRAFNVVDFIYSGLKEKVYTDADRLLISHSRRLTDLGSLLAVTERAGAAQAASLLWRSWRDSIEFMDQGRLKITMDEYRLQHRELCRKLEVMSTESGANELTNLEILSQMFSSKGELSRDIEGILEVLARAIVCSSVESVVESWVSTLEHHASPSRSNMSPERLDDCAMVSINGPQLVHADDVIKDALKLYWNGSKHGDGHFIRRSNNIKCYTAGSAALDSLVKIPCRLAFMTS